QTSSIPAGCYDQDGQEGHVTENTLVQLDFSEILEELHGAQTSGLKILETIRSSYISRAEICFKISENPAIDAYKRALQEHDEHQTYLACQHLRDIRNIYVALNDTINKSSAILTPK
ncbi:hypothetical protein CVT26_002074, partial [Gymnopilus dilepis]